MAEPHEPGARGHLERPIISEREKPALDEATFQQLLEAAHILQEQKTFEVVSRPRPDPAQALAEIVETQEFLRSQPIDLQIAANVVVERLQKITHATGVAVAVVREDRLEYCAAAGDAASLAGTSRLLDSSLAADGQLSTDFSQGHAEKSSIALPLQHEGTLSGLLEVRFANVDSIPAPEMRSCQLMAGLMTEAIAKVADKEWRLTLAAERAAMLEALERIKPQLERLAVGLPKNIAHAATDSAELPDRDNNAADEANEGDVVPVPISESSAKSGRDAICPQCGYQFGERELFCGRCGTARPTRVVAPGDSQSKWASVWDLQQADEQAQQEKGQDSDPAEISAPGVLESHQAAHELSPELKKMMEQFGDEPGKTEGAPENDSALVINGETAEDAAPVSLAVQTPPKSPSPWASATKAHEWLESLHPKSAGGIWLAKHRADLYVGAAVVLLLIVLSGWGMRPPENHPPLKSSQPQLTFFEKLLVNLGLAETPPAPVYLGNPNAQVWVDLHTALYYCSNSDLYGKTPGGKYTTQRDAQLDQFEPAARRNCD